MQEHMRRIDRESRHPLNISDASNGDTARAFTRTSHKVIEAAMQSAAKGKVLQMYYCENSDFSFFLFFL